MKKKLIKIQVINSITGIITSVIWFVLFYFACLKTGNSREFVNLIFPVCLFVISIVGFLISKVRGIKYFYFYFNK